MAVTVRQLPECTPHDAHVLLLCNNCLNEYSAMRDDYFMVDHNVPLTCGSCNHELKLVEKYTSYRPWTAPVADRLKGTSWYRNHPDRGVFHLEREDWVRSGKAVCGTHIKNPALVKTSPSGLQALCKACLKGAVR